MSLNPYTLYLANCREECQDFAKMFLAQRQASLNYLNLYNLSQNYNMTNPLYNPLFRESNTEANLKPFLQGSVNPFIQSLMNNQSLTMPESFYQATKQATSATKNSNMTSYETISKKLKTVGNNYQEIRREVAEKEVTNNSFAGNTFISNENLNVKLENAKEANHAIAIKEEFDENTSSTSDSEESSSPNTTDAFIENVKADFHSNKKNQSAEKKSKKAQRTKIQSKWKNIPGRIISGVQRACRHYFVKNSGIKLDCISSVLENKTPAVQEKFAKFIKKYKTSWKTWSSIARFVFKEGDQETTDILIELIRVILNSDNEFEVWLSQTKMSDVTKTHIRASRHQFQHEFLERLVNQAQEYGN